jgi:hypothetical protein
MTVSFQLLGVVAGAFAAFFRFKSASLPVPRFLQMNIQGPGSIDDIMRKHARLSAIAAGFTAVSVLAQAISTFATHVR